MTETTARGQQGPPAHETFAAQFREAMSRFPSGVTIVTTTDHCGARWGFTASAFCSVSAEPPLVLACLAVSADSYRAFRTSSKWVVNILGEEHAPLAKRFATKGADKFAGGEFDTDADGLPVLPEAVASLVCRTQARHPAGDHVILIGEAVNVRLRDHTPLVYYARDFARLSA
ncbi:flavin reductase family protein [Prauserella muralis]|uniref:flavin reductase family protein n=1 Tax=Prauserella muralis TaxID=588067 RepID=UPI000DD3A9F3|nr:flavin reductase family protein [Prauserella muralis]TWE23541.1 flavin reductase ActVB [Prauserella muralis]